MQQIQGQQQQIQSQSQEDQLVNDMLAGDQMSDNDDLDYFSDSAGSDIKLGEDSLDQEDDLTNLVLASATSVGTHPTSGVTSISGMSKAASSQGPDLSDLWESAPDISSHF